MKKLSGKQMARLWLYVQQNGLCHYCWRRLSLDKKSDNYITIDHVKPKSKGGANRIENYVGACAKCNVEKGNDENYEPKALGTTFYVSAKGELRVTRPFKVYSVLPKTMLKHDQPFQIQMAKQLTGYEVAYTMASMPVRGTVVNFSV